MISVAMAMQRIYFSIKKNIIQFVYPSYGYLNGIKREFYLDKFSRMRYSKSYSSSGNIFCYPIKVNTYKNS